MLNLFSLCSDLKNNKSEFRKHSLVIISQIYTSLNYPSDKTKDIIHDWKEGFRYIYGDVTTNLASNSKLNMDKLLETYGVKLALKNDKIAATQLLLFAIQTFFSLIIKCITETILQEVYKTEDFSHEEIIMGNFAQRYGITNFCFADWYCWPIFELNKGFFNIMDDIYRYVKMYQSDDSLDDFLSTNNYDLIKQIYEAIIPKEIRHALGEFYTPDWLAESTLKNAIKIYDGTNVKKLSIIDPTCGSGTFLFKAIAIKRREHTPLPQILKTVRGIDMNPLAVLTAKTNYLLSILDLVDGKTEITLPVYLADVIKISTHIKSDIDSKLLYTNNPLKAIKQSVKQEQSKVNDIEKADIVVGNPPWVNWEYMPEKYRKESQHYWTEYNLFSAKGRQLSFSKEDISVLITYIVMDHLLKTGGIIGFVIRQGVFKSASNGVGFRKFKIRNTAIQVIQVEDLSKIKVFENATNSTALFFAKKGAKTEYPVPYYLWKKRMDIKKCSFGPYSSLQEVMSQINKSELSAIPTIKDDITSLWITTDLKNLDSMNQVLGTNKYRARTGVFTGGANAIYWLRINSSNSKGLVVTNIVERAKRKSEQLTAVLEKTFVFPMLKGSNVRRWKIDYDTYLLCPHTEKTKMWPVNQKELKKVAPQTMKYLLHFKKDLDQRNGFAGWEKDIQRQEFHAILRIGDYTFSKYKVIWKYIASEFICAVIGSVKDMYLGTKLILPNEKIMYISVDDEMEAYYLCGILSSTIISECVKSYMNPTSISAHILNKLNIPPYNKHNVLHQEIAMVCKEGHQSTDISSHIKKIDSLVPKLYDKSL